MPREFYSASDAARALGISLDTLRRWDRAGRIETSRDAGNRRIVAAAEIDRLRGAAGQRLSARNRFYGTVTEIKVDGLIAQVELQVTDLPAALSRLVGKHLLLLLLAIGFGLTEFLRYVHIDPLLCFLSAGFVVQNLSNQGGKLLHGIEQAAVVVFVVFFATAGAHLDVPLLKQAWPIALALCFGRAFFTWVAARVSSRIAKYDPALRTWGCKPFCFSESRSIRMSRPAAPTQRTESSKRHCAISNQNARNWSLSPMSVFANT